MLVARLLAEIRCGRKDKDTEQEAWAERSECWFMQTSTVHGHACESRHFSQPQIQHHRRSAAME